MPSYGSSRVRWPNDRDTSAVPPTVVRSARRMVTPAGPRLDPFDHLLDLPESPPLLVRPNVTASERSRASQHPPRFTVSGHPGFNSAEQNGDPTSQYRPFGPWQVGTRPASSERGSFGPNLPMRPRSSVSDRQHFRFGLSEPAEEPSTGQSAFIPLDVSMSGPASANMRPAFGIARMVPERLTSRSVAPVHGPATTEPPSNPTASEGDAALTTAEEDFEQAILERILAERSSSGLEAPNERPIGVIYGTYERPRSPAQSEQQDDTLRSEAQGTRGSSLMSFLRRLVQPMGFGSQSHPPAPPSTANASQSADERIPGGERAGEEPAEGIQGRVHTFDFGVALLARPTSPGSADTPEDGPRPDGASAGPNGEGQRTMTVAMHIMMLPRGRTNNGGDSEDGSTSQGAEAADDPLDETDVRAAVCDTSIRPPLSTV